MGACTSANDVLCARKKYSRPNANEIKNIMERPTAKDLSSSMDSQINIQKEKLGDPKTA